MKKVVLKIIFAFVVIPAGVAVALYQLNENGFFNVQKIEIVFAESRPEQQNFLQPLAAKLEAELANYKGISLWSLPLRQLAKELGQHEWIESTAITRSWPHTLSLKIEPHHVKLLFMDKAGQLLPVIQNGNFLSPVEAQQAPDVSLLEGEVFLKKPELRKKAVDLIAEIPDEGAFSKKTISEIRYDQKEGFWMTLIRTGIQVKIGEDKIALKAARVSQVVDYLDSKQFDARVIDANLSKKVLVRLRKQP